MHGLRRDPLSPGHAGMPEMTLHTIDPAFHRSTGIRHLAAVKRTRRGNVQLPDPPVRQTLREVLKLAKRKAP